MAALTVSVPPQITAQPTNQIVSPGSNASFTVTATGTTPLSFQWYYNTNAPLAEATNSTLLLTNVDTANAGFYSVRITNAGGTATSDLAALTVNRPPVPGMISSVTGQQIPVSLFHAALLSAATDPMEIQPPRKLNPGQRARRIHRVIQRSCLVYPRAGVCRAGPMELHDQGRARRLGDRRRNCHRARFQCYPAEPRRPKPGERRFFTAAFEGAEGLVYVIDRATTLAGPWQLGFTNATAGTNGLSGLPIPALPSPKDITARAILDAVVNGRNGAASRRPRPQFPFELRLLGTRPSRSKARSRIFTCCMERQNR